VWKPCEEFLRQGSQPNDLVTFESDPVSGVARFVLISNGSLTCRQANGFLLVIGLFMAFIVCLFCAMGLWVVLPFSGLEWIILAIALHWSLWNSELREVLTIGLDRLIVDRGRRSSGQRCEFQRAWVHLLWREPIFWGYPGVVVLRSH
jgi:uncharacterized membrane protein